MNGMVQAKGTEDVSDDAGTIVELEQELRDLVRRRRHLERDLALWDATAAAAKTVRRDLLERSSPQLRATQDRIAALAARARYARMLADKRATDLALYQKHVDAATPDYNSGAQDDGSDLEQLPTVVKMNALLDELAATRKRTDQIGEL